MPKSSYRTRSWSGRLTYRARISSTLQVIKTIHFYERKEKRNETKTGYMYIYIYMDLYINKKISRCISSNSRPFIAREETKSTRWRKHDESYINITEDREFVGFFDEAIPPFRESDLPVGCILNPLDLKLHSSHFSLYPFFYQTPSDTHSFLLIFFL